MTVKAIDIRSNVCYYDINQKVIKELMILTHSASAVAKWFLTYNKMISLASGDENISNMKLQKLLYYAQGTFLGICGEPIFSESIEAWKHGPVVPDVYREYSSFGGNGIEFDGEFDVGEFDHNENTILKELYEEFGQYSAWKLSEMTHQENPWKDTAQGSVIAPEKIKSYFEEHYVE